MKISAILTTKNDNYGNNLFHRVTMCLQSLIENFDEVIFVDWKVKNDDSVISNIKKSLPHTGKLKNIIVTKNFLQEKYPYISKFNMIESISRNVAIRRTEGDYVISTNIDIITTPLDKSVLNRNIFYTVPRRDVGESFHLSFDNYESLYSNILSKKDSFSPKERIENSTDKWSLISCCGDFQIGHKETWNKMKGFEESILFGCGIDTNVMKKASFVCDIKVLNHYIFHLNHGKNGNRDEDEIVPPMSDQHSIIENFQETTNTENWGMANENFEIEII